MDGDTRECWDHDFTMVWGLGKGKGKFPKGCFERIRQESQIVSSDSIGVYLSVPAWAAGNEGENEVGGERERQEREGDRQTDKTPCKFSRRPLETWGELRTKPVSGWVSSNNRLITCWDPSLFCFSFLACSVGLVSASDASARIWRRKSFEFVSNRSVVQESSRK
ncbi:hypothetical protein BDBG_08538 [Blastomyces gilchristii SLH14081]|uniref:Uncharacterized protein n=1 Tax=Blastomyces gilchristii (strain SLH14081) TaxID=559298 RepID=A0A179UZ06_BLAGS|nr:uncharacterized protein BDBG_08538 [Blastomyces gilchristii SLH14081]OAT13314.1 hypothetical protein BDBG_08538 [Blastomyces gilchristii SLH14081]